ncbi:AbiJ-NTD4 domain-containing protein [Pseudomonas sp. NY15437]|uniref:AbiJ-NTD4 domain-containing protein n=1 Tax=Pseudomonas sp. NY15437 TaxID=3400360 RepID=UPI003A874A16
MGFSEKYGYVVPKDIVQIDSMDMPLRIGLWNALIEVVWSRYDRSRYFSSTENRRIRNLTSVIWVSYLGKALDARGNKWDEIYGKIRSNFFECPWNSVYDFLELVVQNYEFRSSYQTLVDRCNKVLEKEVSAYRFVGKEIVRITEQHEVDEIEQAIGGASSGDKTHMIRALEFLSDRDKPDYRNSIKESISAVESLAQNTLGEKGTLGQLLKKLEEKIELHRSLKSAFTSLYGYASDEDGIRHGMLDEANIKFEDAKFMLVACSAFINLVKVKLAAS